VQTHGEGETAWPSRRQDQFPPRQAAQLSVREALERV